MLLRSGSGSVGARLRAAAVSIHIPRFSYAHFHTRTYYSTRYTSSIPHQLPCFISSPFRPFATSSSSLLSPSPSPALCRSFVSLWTTPHATATSSFFSSFSSSSSDAWRSSSSSSSSSSYLSLSPSISPLPSRSMNTTSTSTSTSTTTTTTSAIPTPQQSNDSSNGIEGDGWDAGVPYQWPALPETGTPTKRPEPTSARWPPASGRIWNGKRPFEDNTNNYRHSSRQDVQSNKTSVVPVKFAPSNVPTIKLEDITEHQGKMLLRSLQYYKSRGQPALTPPPSSNPNVQYCSLPDHSRYAIGTDGSVFDSERGEWVQPRAFRPEDEPMVRGDKTHMNKMLFVELYKDDQTTNEKKVTYPLAEVVLRAHGYEFRSDDDFIVHRNGKVNDCDLTNIYIDSAMDELKREIVRHDRRVDGGALEYRLYQAPGCHWWVGSNGRIWNVEKRYYLEGIERDGQNWISISYVARNGELKKRLMPRARLIYFMFGLGGPLPGKGEDDVMKWRKFPTVIMRTEGNAAFYNLELERRKPMDVPPENPAKPLRLEDITETERQTLSQPPPPLISRGVNPFPTADLRPPHAIHGVVYCTVPNFPDYAVGTDGMVYRISKKTWVGFYRVSHVKRKGRGYGAAVGMKEEIHPWITLYTDPDKGGPSVHFPLDHLVLLAHGYEIQPDEFIVHRDGDRMNFRLENLYVESATRVLKGEILKAHQKGDQPPLEFRPFYYGEESETITPHWWVGSDGQVWSTREARFLTGRTDTQGFNHLRVDSSPAGGVPLEVLRHHLVYRLFQPPGTPKRKLPSLTWDFLKPSPVRFRDGDRRNIRPENLEFKPPSRGLGVPGKDKKGEREDTPPTSADQEVVKPASLPPWPPVRERTKADWWALRQQNNRTRNPQAVSKRFKATKGEYKVEK